MPTFTISHASLAPLRPAFRSDVPNMRWQAKRAAAVSKSRLRAMQHKDWDGTCQTQEVHEKMLHALLGEALRFHAARGVSLPRDVIEDVAANVHEKMTAGDVDRYATNVTEIAACRLFDPSCPQRVDTLLMLAKLKDDGSTRSPALSPAAGDIASPPNHNQDA